MLLSLRGLRVLVSVGFADDRRFVRNVTDTSACCARAASGQATAAPRSVMNSRRRASSIGSSHVSKINQAANCAVGDGPRHPPAL
jgi:hypothetical protein